MSIKHLQLSVLVTLWGLSAADAADWYTGPEAARPSGDWIVAADGAIDASSGGARSASLAVTAALNGSLSQSGARLRVEGLVGDYVFDTAAGHTIGRLAGAGLLGGYEWVRPDLSVAGYAGVSFRHQSVTGLVPAGSRSGGTAGFALAFNLHARPTEATMAHVFASYSSVRNAYYARARFGWALADHVYIGPEAVALGGDAFRQFRFGAHVSGLRLGALQLGLSGGLLSNGSSQTGAYASLDVRTGF